MDKHPNQGDAGILSVHVTETGHVSLLGSCATLPCLPNKFLLSSEDTVFVNSLLRQFVNLLVVGAVPFATFAMAFNRKFSYDKAPNGGLHSEEVKGRPKEPAVKGMKRYGQFGFKLKNCPCPCLMC